jgi:hypothetical protein
MFPTLYVNGISWQPDFLSLTEDGYVTVIKFPTLIELDLAAAAGIPAKTNKQVVANIAIVFLNSPPPMPYSLAL